MVQHAKPDPDLFRTAAALLVYRVYADRTDLLARADEIGIRDLLADSPADWDDSGGYARTQRLAIPGI